MADVRPHISDRTDSGRPELLTLQGAGVAKLHVEQLSFYYGKFKALNSVSFDIPERRITAIIGPSGCGKSTLLRVFNRMYDLVPGARAEGRVLFDGDDIVATKRLLELRQRIGMVFQRPSAFPMSIRDNVAFAPRLLGWSASQVRDAIVQSLNAAALWDEVKDRLDAPATAREVTIAIVTHNMQQAARVSDFTAFMLMNQVGRYGELVEFAPTALLFNQPHDRRTEDYITGRFG